MAETKDVMIVIPVKGKNSTAPPVMEDLARQEKAPDFDVTFVPETEDIFEKIERMDAKIILFLSDSSRLPSADFLRQHFELHQKYTNVWGVSGAVSLREESALVEKCFHYWELTNLSTASMIKPFTRKISVLNSSFKHRIFMENPGWFANQFEQGIIQSGFGPDDRRLAFLPELKITALSSHLVSQSCLVAALRRGIAEWSEGTGSGNSGERYYSEPAPQNKGESATLENALAKFYLLIITLLFWFGWEMGPFTDAKLSRYPSILRLMIGNFFWRLRQMSLFRELRFIFRFVAFTSGYGEANPFDDSSVSTNSGRPISRTASYEIVRLK